MNIFIKKEVVATLLQLKDTDGKLHISCWREEYILYIFNIKFSQNVFLKNYAKLFD